MPIYIRIINKNKKDPNNQIYQEAANYFMETLLARKKSSIDGNVVRLDIKTNAIMHDDGECFSRTLKNKTVTIRVKFSRDISFIDKMVTLAHECVHAKQFMTNELDIAKNSFIWKGKRFKVETDYSKHKTFPWEKEAYRKQKPLAVKFINFYLSKTSFD
jgi:hypothetical protein